MTSLLSRLLSRFSGSIPREDLFTEAVANLFERNPKLCLDWLRHKDLVSHDVETDGKRVIIQTQKWLHDRHGAQSSRRADLFVEVHASSGAKVGAAREAVIIESKIGAKEGQRQLRSYAEFLEGMTSFRRKTLLYITRAYDPKVDREICQGLEGVVFKQVRWHEFHSFLIQVEKDLLIDEIVDFMEEQGMARNEQITATDMASISGFLRVLEIFNETLDAEVRERLTALAGHRPRQEPSVRRIREDEGYYIYAPLSRDDGLRCYAGYAIEVPGEFPTALVSLDVLPGADGRGATLTAMKQLAQHGEYESENLEDPDAWAGVFRTARLPALLSGEDDLTMVKQFFLDNIAKFAEDLKAIKQEHPGLPWEDST